MSSSDLERLYDEHAQALFAFLLSLTRDETDTRDLLQEIFIKLARKPSLMRKVRNERAFLLRLAHNQLIDASRRRQTRKHYLEQLGTECADLFAQSADLDEQQFRQRLTKALAELPPEQRAVVYLKLWEGMTFDAIAGALEISPNTAASRYRYGIDKLRDLLRPLYEEIR